MIENTFCPDVFLGFFNFLLNQISGFYYFKWNIIQSEWMLLGVMHYQILQHYNSNQKYE